MVWTIAHCTNIALFCARFIELTGISCTSLCLGNRMLLLVATLMLNGGLNLSLVMLVAAMFI